MKPHPPKKQGNYKFSIPTQLLSPVTSSPASQAPVGWERAGRWMSEAVRTEYYFLKLVWEWQQWANPLAGGVTKEKVTGKKFRIRPRLGSCWWSPVSQQPERDTGKSGDSYSLEMEAKECGGDTLWGAVVNWGSSFLWSLKAQSVGKRE